MVCAVSGNRLGCIASAICSIAHRKNFLLGKSRGSFGPLGKLFPMPDPSQSLNACGLPAALCRAGWSGRAPALGSPRWQHCLGVVEGPREVFLVTGAGMLPVLQETESWPCPRQAPMTIGTGVALPEWMMILPSGNRHASTGKTPACTSLVRCGWRRCGRRSVSSRAWPWR